MNKKHITTISKVKKSEDNDLSRFIAYLEFTKSSRIEVVDKPDITGSGRFDYLLGVERDKEQLAIEMSQIFESERDRIRSIQWGNAVGAIREQLQRYLQKHKRFPWRGLWSFQTPESFGVNKSIASKFAQKHTPEIIDAIKRKEKSIRIGSFVLKLEKINDQEIGDVFFTTHGTGTFIDAAGVIETRLRKKLPTANKQLDTDRGERILLLVNKYVFGESREVVEALSRINEIWQWESFDKIYLEDSPGHFVLVFDKELRNAWKGEKFTTTNDFLQTFQLWVSHLRKNKPERTLGIVKFVIEDGKPSAILPNTFAREEIVKMGSYFIEKSKLDEARWIIERFIDDPDPVRDGRDFDFDKKIRDGEDPHIITSVRGKLAWVIQKLALKEDTIAEALKYTQQLLKYKSETNEIDEENLYVIQQATVPLVEIARRRVWLQRMDEVGGSRLHNELLNILFALLRSKDAYDRKTQKLYPAMAKYLLDAFSYYRDLNEKQAKEVLDSLGHVNESALLFIYFAVYRKNHFGGDFNPRKPIDFEELLEEKMKRSDKNLRRRIAWHFWRIVDDDLSQIENLEHYITVLSKSPYDRQVFGNLDQLIEVVVKKKKYAKLAAEWFGNDLNGRLKWTKKKVEEDKNFGDWMHYDAIFEGVAEWQPDNFLPLLKKAIEIAETGQVYFYDVKKCFEASKGNPKLSEKKEDLDDLWEKVKKVYPRADDHWYD